MKKRIDVFLNVVEPALAAQLCQGIITHHHGDEDGHLSRVKPNLFPEIADRMNRHIRSERGLYPGFHSVDPAMKLYRLDPTAPAVPEHVDEDFDGPEGTRAIYSVLIKLNHGYEGGETLFEGDPYEPKTARTAIVFPHSIVHSSLPVKAGVKYILKTDIFCRPRKSRFKG